MSTAVNIKLKFHYPFGPNTKNRALHFFLFHLGSSQEFLNVELFGSSTRDRKLLILGRFPRFRTVSAKVITTVTAGTVQQTMKSRKGAQPNEWADFGSGKTYKQPAGVAISSMIL